MRPLPQSLHDRAELLSRSHPERAIAAILGISRHSIFKMKRRGWQAAETTHPFRKRPADFAIQTKHATVDELARHYGTSTRVICRWRREIGQ